MCEFVELGFKLTISCCSLVLVHVMSDWAHVWIELSLSGEFLGSSEWTWWLQLSLLECILPLHSVADDVYMSKYLQCWYQANGHHSSHNKRAVTLFWPGFKLLFKGTDLEYFQCLIPAVAIINSLFKKPTLIETYLRKSRTGLRLLSNSWNSVSRSGWGAKEKREPHVPQSKWCC